MAIDVDVLRDNKAIEDLKAHPTWNGMRISLPGVEDATEAFVRNLSFDGWVVDGPVLLRAEAADATKPAAP